MSKQEDDPDWRKYGLEPQQPVRASKSALNPGYEDSDSDEKELFQEEQKSTEERPWWSANFFISGPVLFGAWDGVFTSCMLNIFGVIIFLRTGWIVGNVGVGLSILIVLITLTVALIGVLSSIGICERCRIESGGVYFLLNHVLGGQLASAIGILYCFGQAVSCSLYTVGFGESISELLQTTDNIWVARGFGIAALLLLMSINMAGVKWVIRLQLILLFTIMVAVVDFLVGSFISYEPSDGVWGYSTQLLQNNTSQDYSNGESFFTVFGVYFPTACGVLAGINMSGDLKEPRKAIAQGTLAATGLSGTLYVIFILILGSVSDRWALKSDYMIAEKISAIGAMWLTGLYVSSITSSMGALYGAPRILQSIANGNNFSAPLSFLGVGRGANKVPVVSLGLVGVISVIFICIGDINFLAPIVTMPFLVTYIAVDYAYFALAMTADLKLATLSHSGSQLTANQYGSVEQVDPSEPQTPASQRRAAEDDSDLDHLFPERKYSKDMESGQPLSRQDSSYEPSQIVEDGSAETDNDMEPVDKEKKIYHMKPSWYSRLCNRWSSLAGAVGTLVIMFATQWLYSLVTIGALAVLYVYLVYAIPGASPGIAQFSFVQWIRSQCKRQKSIYTGQVVVTQHTPLLSTTPAQLNENNEDFSLRKPYHQAQMKSGQDLPLCCDEKDS